MDMIRASTRSAGLVWTRQAVRMAALVLHSFRDNAVVSFNISDQ